MELLAGLNRNRRITIVMVTHEPDMAAFTGRQVRFHDGFVVADERNSAEAELQEATR
jgi:putative ABC transport system ATP-binding protein